MVLAPEDILCSVLDSLGSLERRTILVAVSGGADSVALLVMLHRHASRYGYALRAVTVDHRIRSEAESGGDAAFVQRLCGALEPPVPCELVELAPGEVAALARKRGRGIEEAARHLRYRAIERIADGLAAGTAVTADANVAAGTAGVVVMTAHNRNDRNETVLMRFLQGATGRSLGGIAGTRGRLVRPLLECSHADLCAYLESRGIGWREDATNANGAYLRNRIRLSLVPLLDREFPGWETGVRSGSEKALLDEDLARVMVSASGASWSREPDGKIRCEALPYFSLHPAARLRFLRDGLELLARDLSGQDSAVVHTGRVSGGYLLSLAKLAVPEARTDGRTDAPGSGSSRERVYSGSGLSFVIAGDSVFWGPDIVQNTKSGYLVGICLPGTYHLPYGKLTVAGDGNRVFLDDRLGPFSLPLIIRSRTGGDAVRTADGRQKTLKKLMNDWSVPEPERDLVPLIEQDGEIRAVYGSPLGYPDWYVRL
jgi:tRNA(Ile)-lysidine synthase